MPNTISIKWNQLPPDEWEHALLQAERTAYQQHYAYGDVLILSGRQVARAAFYRGSELIGVAQCAIRNFGKHVHFSNCLRGPVWLTTLSDDEKSACYQLLKSHRPFTGYGAQILMPESHDHEALRATTYRRVMTGHTTIYIDLREEDNAIRQAMDTKWRNRLKAAEGEKIQISNIGKKLEQYAWILEKEDEQSSQRGYQSLPAGFVTLYAQASESPALLGLRATQGNETIGGLLFLLHGNTATYHIGWSNEQGKAVNAHNLLLWRGMSQLKQRGIYWLDLGGVHTHKSGAGLARFKLGLSQNVVQLPGSYI